MTMQLEAAPILTDQAAETAFLIGAAIRTAQGHHENAERFAMQAATSLGLEAAIHRAQTRVALRRAARAYAKAEALKLGV